MANLHLENFAKINNSNLDIQNITVIAGKPGTGKSYIMKILYTLEDALSNATDSSKEILEKIEETNKKLPVDFKEIDDEKIKDFSEEEAKILLNLLSFLDSKLKNGLGIKKVTNDLTVNEVATNVYKNILNSIFGSMSQISSNFKVSYNDTKLTYNAEVGLKVEVNPNEKHDNKKVIFVETPLILEFYKFIDKTPNKTPYHIESLLKEFKTNYSFTDEEQDKFIANFIEKSHDIIQGNIESSGDSFIFNKTNDNNYDIINASSGIKSIGLLQYLVTNKALKNGSVLFWEEPEVHLHPTWQLKMIELFIELMKNGVKIIFSTHSPYMCDYLNAISKKQEIEDKVSFNLLNEEDGVVSNTILNEENWNLLQAELLDPLEEIMWEYI